MGRKKKNCRVIKYELELKLAAAVVALLAELIHLLNCLLSGK